MINATLYPWAYRCPFCNRQVFFFKEKPLSGKTVRSDQTYFEDGTQPKPGDPLVCPRVKCGAKFQTLYTKFVVETIIPKQNEA